VHYIYDSTLSWLDTRTSVESSLCLSGMRRGLELSIEVLVSSQDSELSYIYIVHCIAASFH
jgi:hypothetical protein